VENVMGDTKPERGLMNHHLKVIVSVREQYEHFKSLNFAEKKT